MPDPKICHPWQLFGMQEKSDFARFFLLSRAQTSCLRTILKIHIYDARLVLPVCLKMVAFC